MYWSLAHKHTFIPPQKKVFGFFLFLFLHESFPFARVCVRAFMSFRFTSPSMSLLHKILCVTHLDERMLVRIRFCISSLLSFDFCFIIHWYWFMLQYFISVYPSTLVHSNWGKKHEMTRHGNIKRKNEFNFIRLLLLLWFSFNFEFTVDIFDHVKKK